MGFMQRVREMKRVRGSTGNPLDVMADAAAASVSIRWMAAAAPNEWTRCPGEASSIVPSSPLLGQMLMHPILIARPCTLDAIACNISTAGSAGAVVRMGIYAPAPGESLASTLLVDSGPMDATSTGLVAQFMQLQVSAGMYWLASVSQGSPSTRPTLTCTNSFSVFAPTAAGAAGAITNAGAGYQVNGTTGALPESVSPSGSGSPVPRITVHIAP